MHKHESSELLYPLKFIKIIGATLYYFKEQIQARTQPFSKGGSIRGVSQTMSAFMLWALTHTPPRGVWGHAPPPEIFGNLDFLRVILRHSDSHHHSLPPQFTFMMSS